MNKNFSSFTSLQESFSQIFNNNLDLLQKDLKKNKKISWFIPFIKVIKKYSSYFLILFIGLSLYFSEQVINIFELFLLFDSIILSLLILKNNTMKYYSRRLAKNVISLFILYTNLTGSLASIILFFFLYFEFNKFINKIIYQIIDQIVNFITNTLPFIKDLYPNLKLIDHNKGIESTEHTKESDSDSDSDSDSSSDSDSDSLRETDDKNKAEKLKKGSNKNEYHMYKKIIKNIDNLK